MSNQLENLKKQLNKISKTPSGKRKFNQTFKDEVIQCYEHGTASSSQIVKELKLSTSSLSNWIRGRKKPMKVELKNKFKQVNVIQDTPHRVSSIEIHLPNQVIVRNVDWGYVEKLVREVLI